MPLGADLDSLHSFGTCSGTEWSGAFRMREAHTDDY
jgi:hypothetical protein